MGSWVQVFTAHIAVPCPIILSAAQQQTSHTMAPTYLVSCQDISSVETMGQGMIEQRIHHMKELKRDEAQKNMTKSAQLGGN